MLIISAKLYARSATAIHKVHIIHRTVYNEVGESEQRECEHRKGDSRRNRQNVDQTNASLIHQLRDAPLSPRNPSANTYSARLRLETGSTRGGTTGWGPREKRCKRGGPRMNGYGFSPVGLVIFSSSPQSFLLLVSCCSRMPVSCAHASAVLSSHNNI